MFKNLFNRNLILIIFLCFLSPIFFVNFSIGEILVIGKLIDYIPEKVTYHGVIGCPTENWMYPASFFLSTAIYLIIVISAFLLSKKAVKKNNTNLMLLSAFLFYPVANRWAFKIINLFTLNPLGFIDQKIYLEKQHLALFRNMYNYDWVQFITGNLLSIFYLILAYQIVFHHWDKKLRVQFFTFGLVSCLLGNVFWYFLLGPMIY